MAQGKTNYTQLAHTRRANSYWTYKAFQGQFKPTIGFQATLPEFNRSIERITLPDGAAAFVSRSFVSNQGRLIVNQSVPSLGTNISLSTGIERLDLIYEGRDNEVSYFNTPIQLNLNQPLFQHNALKWNQRIQPLIYEEAERKFVTEMEDIRYDAVTAYFRYYLAQLDVEAARLDKENADSLLVISEGRYSVGRIPETELMIIQLRTKAADQARAQAEIDLENAAEILRQILNIKEEVYFELEPPEQLPNFYIDTEIALSQAQRNRAEAIAFHRRLLESQKQVDQANKSGGLQVDINASFGLSSTHQSFRTIYDDFQDQERISVDLYVPIADWGRTQANREIAQRQLELTNMNIAQERDQMNRQILIKIRQLTLQEHSLEFAKEALAIAEKRLEISQKRYFIGKIDILDLNSAILEKESARKTYVSSLMNYYLNFYEIQRLTLYDFIKQAPVTYEKQIN